MASSRRSARIISSVASSTYLLLVILQVPLFSVPCRTGICSTPVEITSSQLMTSELFPQTAMVVKALLYPGALASAFLHNGTLPDYHRLLESYNLTSTDQFPVLMDLRRIEILAGSYLMVVGALLSLIKPVRMSFFGALLVIWGLSREIFPRDNTYSNSTGAVFIYPTMFLAVASAFFSMQRDVRRIVRHCRNSADKNRRAYEKEKKV